MQSQNAITNVQIKPNSKQNQNQIGSFSKGLRAKRLCSEIYLQETLNFLINMFVENGHDRYYLNSIAEENKHQAPEAENTYNSIVKLRWMQLVVPKKRKELQKIGLPSQQLQN